MKLIVAAVVALTLSPRAAHADAKCGSPAYDSNSVVVVCPLVHAELDPLTFANGGYGGQIGLRLPNGLRFAIASFSLHVPDALSQIGGNDGFDERVRPSGALYALYYFAPPGHNGFSVGGSIRYLRVRYEHDDEPGLHADISQLSPEAIVGYQWHPFHNGFYLQPWFALGVALWTRGEPVVGAHRYDALPVSPFFTVNIGYELAF